MFINLSLAVAGEAHFAIRANHGIDKSRLHRIASRYTGLRSNQAIFKWVQLKKPSAKKAILVPGAGIEPARPQWPQDFKSCVSTSSTTRAI